MAPPMAFPCLGNGFITSHWMCPNLFQPCSTLIHQFGAPRPAYGHKMAILAHLSHFEGIWRPPMVIIDPGKGPNTSPRVCPNLFQPCSTLFHQFGTTRSAFGRKRPFLAVLDPVWGPSGAPIWPSLTRETVSMHHRGYALPCSTLVPLCSTSLEPPDSLMAQKGRFWPFWTLFGHISGQNGWNKSVAHWNKSILTKTKQKTSLVVMENQLRKCPPH